MADNQWKPVVETKADPITKDAWNSKTFQPVKTTALRIKVELQLNFSGGILEWRVK